MANENSISLKAHLADQSAHSDVFLATIEGLPDAKVKITPWTEGGGCLCAFAFVVDEDAVKELTRTADFHSCCGKRLNVVEVAFAETYRTVAQVVLQQVVASELARHTSTGNIAGGGVAGWENCTQSYLAALGKCLSACRKNGNCENNCYSVYHKGLQLCANAFGLGHGF